MTVKLPTKKRPINLDLGGQFILIYGPEGVGKTTWANGFPDTLFFATEDGQRFLELLHMPINSWQDFLDAYQLLRKKKARKRYKTFAIDTIDNLWNFCVEHVGKKHGFTHPSEEKWGKGYDLIKSEFTRGMVRLANLGTGIILVSHAQDREVKTRTLTLTKTMPTLPNQARRVIMPMASVIIYASFKTVKDKETGETKEIRVAITKPTESTEAKDRTGRLPPSMPLRAKRFIKAFKEGKK